MSTAAPACTWIGEWADALAACVRWSREKGHCHRIAWDTARGGWRITCVLPPAEKGQADA
jgi:hypothetical protein